MIKATMLASAFLLINMPGASAQKTITFESKDKKSKSPASGKHNHKGDAGYAHNSVTIGLLQYVDGYLPIYYERSFGDVFSLCVGAGPTFHSHLADVGLAVYSETETPGGYTENRYYSYAYREARTGYSLIVSPRLYYNESAMDGTFFSPTFEDKHYAFRSRLADETHSYNSQPSFSTTDEIARAGGAADESMNCIDITAVSGGHYQLRHHIVLGWTVGIGARFRNSTRLDYTLLQYAAGGYHYVNALRSYSVTRPVITIGFTIGGWF